MLLNGSFINTNIKVRLFFGLLTFISVKSNFHENTFLTITINVDLPRFLMFLAHFPQTHCFLRHNKAN